MTRPFDIRRHISACALLLALAQLGCDGRAPQASDATRRASTSATGDVLAVADGMAIRAKDVAELHASGQLPARQALTLLEEEALLMAEAERRGYAARPEVIEVERQAMVQAYLGARAAELEVSDVEVAAAYEEAKSRYVVPERRAFHHLLAPLPRDRAPTAAEELAARQLAEQAVAAINVTGVDAVDVLRSFSKRALPFAPSLMQKVPRTAAEGLVKPFADALFAAWAPGPLPTAVRTSFGWHAVVLDEIVPARNVSLEQATAELREGLLTRARTDALKKQVEELRASYRPQWTPEHKQLLDAPRFDD